MPPNRQTLKTLLQQLGSQKRQADVIERRDLLVHPLILASLARSDINTKSKARLMLRGLCDPVTATNLNQESRYNGKQISAATAHGGNVNATGPCKLENWCAGQTGFYRFKSDVLQADMDLCFNKIAEWYAAFTGDSTQDVLQRNNFFHGHLILFPEKIWAPSGPELFILFHAMEYPEQLPDEIFKVNCAKAVLGNDYKGFSVQDAKYRWRNALWSLSLGKVWFFNFSNNFHPYKDFLDDPNLNDRKNPTTIGQDSFGVDNGNVLAHINYFPGEWEGKAPAKSFWSIMGNAAEDLQENLNLT
ncbi:hypothetical protein F0U59_04140 [Archangium gephyra]|nr:hypothetical protein F0U59_04140 [Archangium gephyra]